MANRARSRDKGESMDIGDQFERIVSVENLYAAAHAAALGKRCNDEVSFYNFRLEAGLDALRNDLVSGQYRHGRYKIFEISEPKKRSIAKAPFRDRVVHHAVHDVIEPVIDRSFIDDSYACRKGKGTHSAINRAQGFLMAKNYCLHGDIRKYFPSINREILKRLLSRYVREPRLWALLVEIIDSARYVFPGDAGLPIGNLTSQFFANLYLHQLDRFVAHELKCRYYIRYMDDFLLFDNDPEVLLKWRAIIADRLASELCLCLHQDKTGIFPARRGLTFLGFYLSRGRRRVSAAGMRRVRARVKLFRYLAQEKAISEAVIADSFMCWAAHSRYADTTALRQSIAENAATWSDALPAAVI
jgi:retron-type reverse transcriptase